MHQWFDYILAGLILIFALLIFTAAGWVMVSAVSLM